MELLSRISARELIAQFCELGLDHEMARNCAILSANQSLELVKYLNHSDSNFPKIQIHWENVILMLTDTENGI